MPGLTWPTWQSVSDVSFRARRHFGILPKRHACLSMVSVSSREEIKISVNSSCPALPSPLFEKIDLWSFRFVRSPDTSTGEAAGVHSRGCGWSECRRWGSLGTVVGTELPPSRHGVTIGKKPGPWLFTPHEEASCIARDPRTGVWRGTRGGDLWPPRV